MKNIYFIIAVLLSFFACNKVSAQEQVGDPVIVGDSLIVYTYIMIPVDGLQLRLNPPEAKVKWEYNYSGFYIECFQRDSRILYYELFRNGISVGELVSGTMSVFSFPRQTAYGVYVVKVCDINEKLLYNLPVEMIYPSERRTETESWSSERTFFAADSMKFYDDITYYNDLGLPMQQIAVGASPETLENIVQDFSYDPMLRGDAKVHMPYPSTKYTGEYLEDGASKLQAFYPIDSYLFTKTEYECSPLGRPVSVTKPGDTYARHPARFAYGTNASDEVMKYKVFPDVLLNDGFYPAGSLQKRTTTDEDGHVRHDYTTTGGLKVLERAVCDGKNLDTYYLYDQFDRVVRILAPTLGFPSEGTPAYSFSYDRSGNVCSRSLPQTESDEYIYDLHNRLIFSRISGKWRYFEYDVLDRLTGWAFVTCTDESKVADFRNRVGREYHFLDYSVALNSNPTRLYPPYTDSPFGDGAVSSVTRYGNSRFGTPGIVFEVPTELHFRPFDGIGLLDLRRDVSKVYEKVGLITPRLIINSYTERAFYYDAQGRLIQTVERTYDGYILVTSQHYDFLGNVSSRRVSLSGDGIEPTDTKTVYTYDSRGRVQRERVYVNNVEKTTGKFQYDRLGRLSRREYTCSANSRVPLSEDLKYTLHGQLSSKIGNLFSEWLCYENSNNPSYSGNVTDLKFGYGQDVYRHSRFTYDALSRLKTHTFLDYEPVDTETDLTYDGSSNIRRMSRRGLKSENVYVGNELDFVFWSRPLPNPGFVGESDYFEYDSYGRQTRDGIKNLRISYNPLNLVSRIQRRHTDGTSSYVAQLCYLSDGTKQESSEGANGDDRYRYFGSLLYKHVNGIFSPESFSFSGGRFVAIHTSSGVIFEPRFYALDHLGSVRMVASHEGPAIEWSDYMAFGLRVDDDGYARSDNRYLFNGKELVAGIYLDYGARMYDPTTCRWLTPDPLAVSYASTSPYAYCLNNPVRYVDLFGLKPDNYELHPNGGIEFVEKTNDPYDVLRLSAEDEGNTAEAIKVVKNVLREGFGGTFTLFALENYLNIVASMRYEIGSYETATALFEFVANNSAVEWGLIRTATEKNFVYTSFNYNSLYESVAFFDSIGMTEFTHSHPRSFFASGADKFFALQYPTVTYKIYHDRNYFPYNFTTNF